MAIDLNKRNDIPEEEKNQNVLDSESTENGVVEKQRLFVNPFSFSGRIRRLEFGLSYIIYMLCIIVTSVSVENSPIWGLLVIPLVWFWLAQLCKRFHDRNKPGLHVLFLIIPLYNLYVILMQFFADGDPYENDYGPDPKGRNMYA